MPVDNDSFQTMRVPDERKSFQSPGNEPQVIDVLSGTRDDMRKVAKYQKGILVCIPIKIVTAILQFLLPAEFRFVFLQCVLPVELVGTVFEFLLANKVYNPVIGVLLGIFAIVPAST